MHKCSGFKDVRSFFLLLGSIFDPCPGYGSGSGYNRGPGPPGSRHGQILDMDKS